MSNRPSWRFVFTVAPALGFDCGQRANNCHRHTFDTVCHIVREREREGEINNEARESNVTLIVPGALTLQYLYIYLHVDEGNCSVCFAISIIGFILRPFPINTHHSILLYGR
jgi:hypothetical protein